jgi:hypothetical protein
MNLKKHFDAAETGIQLDRKAGRADITLDVTGDVLHTCLTCGDHHLAPKGRLQERLDLYTIGDQIEVCVVFLVPKDEEDDHIWISSATEQPSGWPFKLDDPDAREFFTLILRDIL